ncbi:PREDICTED: DNA topoisomerase 1 [Tarenaya hassleriana]|uniref:DNA topoisomerase 1 n=1 Tax=Tarenaya hassleriana TaxID=28532 RepID=UPI00053C437D|nr:PREDICTED: DNA topoisomerase 1 [Tarenaya hassleriana]
MAFSNTGIFLSDTRDLTEAELGFFHEPVLGFSDRKIPPSPRDHGSDISIPRDQNAPDQDREDKQKQDQDQEREKSKRFREERENERDDDDDDGASKTPIRSDQMIPATPRRCPAAPRKVPARRVKKIMSDTGGRCRRRIFVDASREIESLFPQTFLEDLSNKMKKARYC